jgi:hypothetical protein
VRPRLLAIAVLASAAALVVASGLVTGSAAGLSLSSQKLTVWKSATTVPVCASPGNQTITTNRDAYLDQADANKNLGTGVSDLFVMSKSGSDNRRLIVGFTLPAVPAGCSVTAATLRLNSTSGVSGRTIDAYRAGGTWTEGGVTWNNQPSMAGTAVGAPSSSATGWRTWDVLAHVQAMYSGSNDGFLLRDRTEGTRASPEQKYQSREGSPNDPQLVLTFG